jgi:hypothetical protein
MWLENYAGAGRATISRFNPETENIQHFGISKTTQQRPPSTSESSNPQTVLVVVGPTLHKQGDIKAL